MLRTRRFEWHTRFKAGREEVEDDHCGGRAFTSRTDENVERVRQKVRTVVALGMCKVCKCTGAPPLLGGPPI